MLCLVARHESQVIRWRLPEAPARLGSASDNDLVLRFPGISRHHATIARSGAGVRLVDAGSKNGILRAGERVAEVLLRPGEAVVVGRATLHVEDARTSDVELALATDVRHSSGGFEETPPENDGGGAAAALRMIREIEARGPNFSGKRRQQVLERALDALGCTTLALCHASEDSDVSVVCITGPLPAARFLEDAEAFKAGKRAWRSFATSHGDARAIVAGRASHCLLAVWQGGAAPADWAEDLVTYLAEKLIGAPAVQGQPEQRDTQAAEALLLPDGMIVGTSDSMRRLLHQVAATVGSRMDVLLLGETGTGKELFARMIHASGPNRKGPFVAINCAAIPAELLEAELFGVQGRVATGVDPRMGLFMQADGGTILLDEIGELPDRLQAKLLRVLQEREVLPIGGTHPKKVDVRVVSASNRDLEARVREGHFRADLYYRIRPLQFHIPPLRDRKDDIPALVLEFVLRAASAHHKTILGVSRSALALLIEHDWPGNVRELESEVGRAVLVCPSGGIVQPEHLGTVRWMVERNRAIVSGAPASSPAPPSIESAAPAPSPHPSSTLRDKVDQLEREEIERVLAATNGNQSAAAKLLGLTRNGLAMKLKRLGRR